MESVDDGVGASAGRLAGEAMHEVTAGQTTQSRQQGQQPEVIGVDWCAEQGKIEVDPTFGVQLPETGKQLYADELAQLETVGESHRGQP